MSGTGLLRDLEELFQNSEQRVLAAFVATKCDPAASGTRARRPLPKSTGKARVICLTAKRRSEKRGFKGTVHICKLSHGRYQVRKSVRLKLLTRIEAFVDSPGQQEYFELTFLQRGFTSGEVRLAFEVRSALVRLKLLGTLYTFCRTHEQRAPQLLGIDASELESSAALYNKQVADSAVGQTARTLLKEAARGEEAAAAPGADGSEDGDGAHPLWGQREDKQIQSLLEMVSVGAASMEELQERLAAELAALEDASVHEILENGGSVSRVAGELEGAIGLLEDLGENLDIFDAKLRHMREDIAAIEGRNNQLELHSRNNQKLLASLEGLVERLSLPDAAERALHARDITAANMPQVVAAAWDLHQRLQALSDSGSASQAAAGLGPGPNGEQRLPRGIPHMSAVASQRQRLYALQRSFLERATACLQEQLARVADAAVQQVEAQQGAARLRPPSHASVRRRAAELAPLLEVVGVLRPAASVAPREAYCAAVAGLLQREVHAAASELLRMAAAADAGGQLEPDLLGHARPASSADSASSRERTSMRVQASSHSRISAATSNLSAQYREAGITPLHEGYELLLDLHMPVLAEEVAHCIALMFPKAAGGPSSAQLPGGSATEAGAAVGKSVRFAAGEAPAAVPPAPHVLDAEVQATVASLLAGIERELVGLVDGIKPPRLLLCLPMLGATLAWKQRLAAKGAACRPLVELLGACEKRLTALLEGYFAERAAAIQRYDGRSSMSVGGGAAKAQHILPFILNFPAVAGRIEQLLDRWPVEQPAAGGVAEQEAKQQDTPGSARRPPLPPSAGRQQAGQAQAQALAPSPFESSGSNARPPPGVARRGTSASESVSEVSSLAVTAEDESDLSFMSSEADSRGRRTTDASGDGGLAAAAAAADRGPQALLPAGRAPPAAQQPAAALEQQQQLATVPGPGAVLRELADAGYDSWLRAMSAAVEALGASDPKHGQRLRLENYAAWQQGLQGLPVGRAAVLSGFAGQVAAHKERAMAAYIEQQVDYFRFTRVLEFSRRLDEAMQAVGSADVHLQQQFQPGEVRQLLAATTTGLDKKLVQVRQRILKHLAATSPGLVDQVWDKLERICLERWGRMEEQLRQCYSGIELRPPLAELRSMFRAARAAGQ